MNVTAELVIMADSLKTIICRNVVRLAKEDKVSGAQLSRILDVAPPNVSRWFNHKSRPDDAIIDKMRELLGWRLEELMWEPEADAKPPERTERHKPLTLIESIQLIADACGFERPRLRRKSQS